MDGNRNGSRYTRCAAIAPGGSWPSTWLQPSQNLAPRSLPSPAETGLITVVPDDNAALLGFQVVTGLAAGAGAVTLWGASFFFSLLQGDN